MILIMSQIDITSTADKYTVLSHRKAVKSDRGRYHIETRSRCDAVRI